MLSEIFPQQLAVRIQRVTAFFSSLSNADCRNGSLSSQKLNEEMMDATQATKTFILNVRV